MVDASIGPGTIDTRDDLGTGDVALFRFWEGQERIAEKEEGKWTKRARAIVKRYRDERPESMNTTHKFNVLWSNVQTLKPILYARTPKPDVQRRYLDQDDTGRLASTLLERCLSYSLAEHGFDQVMEAVVEDRLLPGRGTARVLYIPHFGEPFDAVGDNEQFEAEEAAPADIASPGDKGEAAPTAGNLQPSDDALRELLYEETVCTYVFWEDYREGPARTWREVPWLRYRAYMSRDELVARFGKKKGNAVELDYAPRGSPENDKEKPPPDIFKKAVIHEVWDKVKKEVVWYAPGTPDLILDQLDDPLRLRDFYPSPDPLLATTTNNTRVPVPDYVEYQDQARELDTLTSRIDRLTRALKVSGVYPGAEKQVLQQLVDEGTENRLIPVEDWGAFSEKGGLKGFIQWMPIEQVAQTLIQLYDARDRVKAILYEITGIGDVMRGNTQPLESATAQTLKAAFSTRRVTPQQRAVARFARDLIRIEASIIAEHFSAETISEITGYPVLAPVPQLPPSPMQWIPAPPQIAAPPQPGAPPGAMPMPPHPPLGAPPSGAPALPGAVPAPSAGGPGQAAPMVGRVA